ncbi:unnamed protein product [Penicillium olsonii]|nr:unnamed protein product [Penicillium olsonii]
MDPLSTTTAILALLETSIGIVSRLRVAYSRQRAQKSVIDRHNEELQGIESVIQVIRQEECLQTAAVVSELVKIKDLSQELLTLLRRLDPGDKSLPRQIAHQLSSGSKDEADLDSILKRINTAKTNLLIHIQVAGVGLSRDGQNNIVANTAEISNLDRTIKTLLGDEWGLKIASLIQHKPLQDSNELDRIGISTPKGPTTRIIIGNLTRSQALQINGPVGEDEWKSISHLEIRDNEAGLASSQVNYPVSRTVFASLLFDHSIKYILLFVLIYLPFDYFFGKR